MARENPEKSGNFYPRVQKHRGTVSDRFHFELVGLHARSYRRDGKRSWKTDSVGLLTPTFSFPSSVKNGNRRYCRSRKRAASTSQHETRLAYTLTSLEAHPKLHLRLLRKQKEREAQSPYFPFLRKRGWAQIQLLSRFSLTIRRVRSCCSPVLVSTTA